MAVISFDPDVIRVPVDIAKASKQNAKNIKLLTSEIINLLGEKTIDRKKIDNSISDLQKNYDSITAFYLFFKGTRDFEDSIGKKFEDSNDAIGKFNKAIEKINEKNQGESSIPSINYDKPFNDLSNFLEENFAKQINIILHLEKELSDKYDEAKNKKYKAVKSSLVKKLYEKIKFDQRYKNACILIFIIMYLNYKNSIYSYKYVCNLLDQTIKQNSDGNMELVNNIDEENIMNAIFLEIQASVKTFEKKYTETYFKNYNKYFPEKKSRARKIIVKLTGSNEKKLKKEMEEQNDKILGCFEDFHEEMKSAIEYVTRFQKTNFGDEMKKCNLKINEMREDLIKYIRLMTNGKFEFKDFKKIVNIYNESSEMHEHLGKTLALAIENNIKNNNNKLTITKVKSRQNNTDREKNKKKLRELQQSLNKAIESFKKACDNTAQNASFWGTVKRIGTVKLPKFMLKAARIITIISAGGLSVSTGQYGALLSIMLNAGNMLEGDSYSTNNMLNLINQLNAIAEQTGE